MLVKTLKQGNCTIKIYDDCCVSKEEATKLHQEACNRVYQVLQGQWTRKQLEKEQQQDQKLIPKNWAKDMEKI